ncbi:uncharacterized protein tnxba [Brachyhypopomus gauderio]|uniref:uncharacterized protein tnxba n=1 Tax=Brachyhypopomus gauderio TaxID=698409 RepID=UPI004043505E
MLISLAFLFLLTPLPSLQASISERKNSTKPTPHATNLNVPKPLTSLLSVKTKPQKSPGVSKVSNVSQTLSSTAKSAVSATATKASKDEPPSASPITVIISEGCSQKVPKKDPVNATRVRETELSVKPGSPLVMTHHISVLPGACTGGCESEMTALKGRVELLEKEVSSLKKKCILCSDERCPNECSNRGKCEGGKCVCHHGFSGPDCSGTSCPSNCSKKGMCVNGKCVCQTGFTGLDCSKEADKKTKVTVGTLPVKVSSVSSTAKQDMPSGKKTKAEQTIFLKKVDEKEPTKDKKDKTAGKPSASKPAVKTSITKDQSNDTRTKKETPLSPVLLNHEGAGLQEQVTRGKTTQALGSEKPLQTHIKSKGSSKAEPMEKLVKQESVIQKVTQSTSKKSNATSKVLVSLSKGTKESSNATVQTSTGKGKQSHVNVTSAVNDKRKLQANGTIAIKGGASGKQKTEKFVNVTTSSEKDKKQHFQGNITLAKDGSTRKKKVDLHLNATTLVEKELLHGNVTSAPKGGAVEKKIESRANFTTSYSKSKERLYSNETKALKEVAFGTKKDKQTNVTASTEKEKRQQQGTVTLPKEGTSGKRKDNITTSNEKALLPSSETTSVKEKEVTSGKKTVGKNVNITASPEKIKKLPHGTATVLKGGESGKKKVDMRLNITAVSAKEKKLLPGDETTLLKEVADGKKKVEKHVNVTASIEKGKKAHQGNITVLKEEAPGKRKINLHVNAITISEQKDKGLAQGDATDAVKETTVSTETDKKLVHSNTTTDLRESIKKNVYSEEKLTSTQSHINRTTKFISIGPVEAHNITATGFVITWEAPQGAFKTFTVTIREVPSGSKDEVDVEEADGEETTAGIEVELHSSNRTSDNVHKTDRSSKKVSKVLAGSTRSYQFRNLQAQTRYSVSVVSSGPGLRSKVHYLFVSTGPEPPTDLLFSNITQTSLSVSWTKPKSKVSDFMVTYTNSANGETGSMSVDSQLSHVLISKLSAGSTYDISVRSILERTESEPITASVTTVPFSPTDVQAVNVTDTKALLLWKPAQAKVDHYILTYGSSKSPNVTVTVMLSGSSVEHQLRGLHRSTVYTVKIRSQINSLQSSSVSTSFTTASGVTLQTVTPSEVTFSSAVISWKAPHLVFRSYRLTYQLGEEIKEVILNPSVTQYQLTGLIPFSNYTVRVDGESEGQYISLLSTTFTTARLSYPHPTDCSQVRLNGVRESGEAEIYPEGADGEPVWVYCDMETDGGGWTVFQRRKDGSTDFFRGWKDYSKGFGQLSAEFWLGNDLLHTLTRLASMSLRIDLHSGNDTVYAHYSSFTVGSEANHYAIELSGYSGTAGDSMRYHNGRPFSTKDKDPSPLGIHCAKAYMGGWWYKNCYKANLNGRYATFSENQGVVWIDWKGKDNSLPFAEMKVRPASLRTTVPPIQG